MRRDAQMYRAWLGPRTATEISRPYIRPESQVAEPEQGVEPREMQGFEDALRPEDRNRPEQAVRGA